jgi:hypothetical protein
MRRWWILIAAGILVAADVVALLGAASGRRGGPDAKLSLTERELHLIADESDNSAVILTPRYGEIGRRFGERSVPLSAQQAEALGLGLHSARSTAIRAYAAMEVGADAPELSSRLRPVDTALDAASLRARYPDRSRYAIAQAIVRTVSNGQVFVVPLPEQIYVPGEYASTLRRSSAHFKVTLCYSRNGDCWVCGAGAP